jgi:hypothetical protein
VITIVNYFSIGSFYDQVAFCTGLTKITVGWTNGGSHRSVGGCAHTRCGRTLAVGAPWSPINGEASGNVRVFKLNTETETKTWEQQGREMQGRDLGRWFGNTLIISHDGLTIAASIWDDIPGRPVIDFAGVRVFRFDSAEGEWIELGDGVPGQTL